MRLFLVLVGVTGASTLAYLPAQGQYYGTPYQAPAYTPTYSYSATQYPYKKVVVAETVYQTVPYYTPDVVFQFVAAPSTPPPVVIAAPPQPKPAMPPPMPATMPATMPAHAYNGHSLVSTPTPPGSAAPDLEARLARIEAVLERLVESRQDLPPPVAGPAGQPITAAYASRVALLQNRCAQCHSGRRARGDVQLFNDQGQYQPNVSDAEIWDSVKPRPDGRPPKMPRGPQKIISEAELALLRPGPAQGRRRVSR